MICRGTDISKYFIESLGFRDNKSRLYYDTGRAMLHYMFSPIKEYVKIMYFATPVMKQNRNNPKYWDTLSAYHTCPRILNSPF